ncbi:MAG TPA: cupin domain-containing protein [Candidatus Dormibacteraeota bacterium]|nr:cupin domain-containing protein [Candidatus Dormibacteraeota bacterium]
MSTYASVAGLQPRQIWAGAVARPLHGERMTVGFIDLEPLTQVPEHRHDNEQLGFVLKGSITMVIDGERRELHVGDAYTIRSGIPHSAETGPDGATVVDVFAPVRSDWNGTPRLPVEAGRWP